MPNVSKHTIHHLVDYTTIIHQFSFICRFGIGSKKILESERKVHSWYIAELLLLVTKSFVAEPIVYVDHPGCIHMYSFGTEEDS